MRREFPAKIKIAAFERANGCCELCGTGKRLLAHDIRYDHIIPDGIGGEPTLANCQVLCRAHHDAKTFGYDVPRIAKTKRIKRRAIGIRKPSRFPGSRDSGWKKKIGGEVVRR